MKHSTYFKEFVRYAALNVLGMLGLSCYILADTFFIANSLGTSGLVGLNLAIPVYSFIHGTGMMLGMGGATQYSILKGQKKDREADSVFTNILSAALFVAAVFTLTGGLASKAITDMLGADAQVFQMTNTYLKVLLLFAPAFLLNDVLICFVRNDGNPRLAMLGMLLGSLSNIILDYVFLFPLKMGMFGAVFATSLAPVISMVVLSRHWRKRRNGFHVVRTKPDIKQIGAGLSLGFPSLVTEVSSGIVILVFNRIIFGLQGNVGVGAYGVIANLSLVIVSIYTGIAQGIQPLISRAHGSGDRMVSRDVLRYAVITSACISCAVYVLFFRFADPIVQIFNSEKNLELQRIATEGMRYYFTVVFFVGFNIIISVFFTSTERAFAAHVISVMRGLIIIIPMAAALSKLAGIIGVWMAFPVTEFLVASVAFLIYLRLRNRDTTNMG